LLEFEVSLFDLDDTLPTYNREMFYADNALRNNMIVADVKDILHSSIDATNIDDIYRTLANQNIR